MATIKGRDDDYLNYLFYEKMRRVPTSYRSWDMISHLWVPKVIGWQNTRNKDVDLVLYLYLFLIYSPDIGHFRKATH